MAILHSVDRGHGGRSDSLRLGEAQDMKASEFVHKASFARFHVLVISQDIRSELLSVKSRPQQYMQDSSPPSNDDGNNNEDQHTMSCSLGRSSFDFI